MEARDIYHGLRAIMVCMEKGGSTKTTIALNLAIRGAQGDLGLNKRVLLVDLDGQQNASRSLIDMQMVMGTDSFLAPIHPDYREGDPEFEGWQGRTDSMMLYYGEPFEPYQSSVIDGLDVIPSDGSLMRGFEDMPVQGAESSEGDVIERIAANLRDFLSSEEVRERYDLVIFDCPPGKTIVTAPLFKVVTDVIMPFQPDQFGMDGVLKMYRQIEKENERRRVPINIMAILPTKVRQVLSHHAANLKVARDPSVPWSQYVTPFSIRDSGAYSIENLPITPGKKFRVRGRPENDMKKLVRFVKEKLA